MADAVERLLFQVLVNADQLTELPRLVENALQEAGHAAENARFSPGAFEALGAEGGAQLKAGLVRALEGQSVDVFDLLGLNKSAASPQFVRQLESALANVTEKARRQGLASVEEQVRALEAYQARLSRLSISRETFVRDPASGQPVARRNVAAAAELGVPLAPTLTGSGAINQAAFRRMLEEARARELTQTEQLLSRLRPQLGGPAAATQVGSLAQDVTRANYDQEAARLRQVAADAEETIARFNAVYGGHGRGGSGGGGRGDGLAGPPDEPDDYNIPSGRQRLDYLARQMGLEPDQVSLLSQQRGVRGQLTGLAAEAASPVSFREYSTFLERATRRGAISEARLRAPDAALDALRSGLGARAGLGEVGNTQALAALASSQTRGAVQLGQLRKAAEESLASLTAEYRLEVETARLRGQRVAAGQRLADQVARGQAAVSPEVAAQIPAEARQRVLDRLEAERVRQQADLQRRGQTQEAAQRRALEEDARRGGVLAAGTSFTSPDQVRQAELSGAAQRQTALAEARRLSAFDQQLVQAEALAKIEEENAGRMRRIALAEARRPGSIGAEARSVLEATPEGEAALRDAQTVALGESRARRLSAQRTRLQNYIENDPTTGVSGLLRKGAASALGRAPGDTGEGYGGLKSEFLSGFLGSQERLTFQAGQTAKFSLFYGGAYQILNTLTSGFSAAVQGAKEYEQALTQLDIVTGRTRQDNEALANTAGRLGTSLGLGAAAGVSGYAQSLGLYGLANAPEATQRAVGLQSTAVAGRVAQLSGQDISQVGTQLAAVVRSFGISQYDTSGVEDKLAVISRESGRPAGELLQAAAEISDLASTAGYTLSQTLAMVSQVTSRTGQTPEAVAGYLGQIFSKTSDPNVLAALSGLGINTSGTSLADQLTALGKANLSGDQLNQIVQQFGRGRSGQALQIILGSQDRIGALTSAADNAAPGSGQRQFEQFMSSIGNQLRLLGADAVQLGKDLAESGFLDFLAALVKGADYAVQSLDHVVQVFNSIPRPIREVIATLIELRLAAALLSGTGGRAAAFGNALLRFTGGGAAAAGAAGAAKAAAAAAPALADAGAAAAGTAAVRASVRGASTAVADAAARAGVTGAVRALAGPISLALGPITGLASASQSTNEGQDLLTAADRAVRTGGDTVAGLKDAAGLYATAAKHAIDEQSYSLESLLTSLDIAPTLNKIPDLSAVGITAPDRYAEAKAKQNAADAQAKTLQDALDKAQQVSPQRAFQDFASATAVSNGLQQLSAQGYTAAQQVQLLNKAFAELITKSNQGAAALGGVGLLVAGQGPQFGVAVGTSVTSAQQGIIDDLRLRASAAESETTDPLPGSQLPAGYAARSGRAPTSGNRRASQLRAVADQLSKVDPLALQKQTSDKVLEALRQVGVDPSRGNAVLTKDNIALIQDTAEQVLTAALGPTFTSLGADDQRLLAINFLPAFQNVIKNYAGTTVTPSQVQAFTTADIPTIQTAGQNAGILAHSPLVGAEKTLTDLQAAQVQADAALRTPYLDERDQHGLSARIAASDEAWGLAIAQASDTVAQGRISLAQSLLAVAQSNRNVDDKVGRDQDTINTYTKLLSDPTVVQNPDLLAQITAARNNAVAAQAVDARNAAASNALAALDPRDSAATLRTQRANAIAARNAAPVGSAARGDAQQQINQLDQQEREYAVTLAAAQRAAALTPGDQTQVARNAVTDAADSLHAQLAGTAAWYQAYAAHRQAQYQLTQVLIENANSKELASIDQTDPVQAAQARLDAINRQVKNAQSADERARLLPQQQQAGSDRVLSGYTEQAKDLQTAHSLRRISDQQYIASLRAEESSIRLRLKGMSSTTTGYRALLDEANQLDQTIQDAMDSYSGQWNLGDITVPTIYQVRQAIGAGAGSPTSVAAPVTNNVTINGADFSRLVDYINTMFGSGGVSRTTVAARRA